LKLKNKNITLRVVGGLGNQLFIFSFLLYLKKRCNIDVYLDHKSGYQKVLGSNVFNQMFLLKKINYKFKYQIDFYCFLGIKGKIKRFLIKNTSFFSKFYEVCYVEENDNINIIKTILETNQKNIYISGYFQNLKYINTNQKYLKKIIKISFKNEFNKKNRYKPENTMCILQANYKHENNNEKLKFINQLKFLFNKLKNINFFIIFSLSRFNKLKDVLPKGKYKYIKPNSKKNSFKNLIFISKFKYFFLDHSTYHWWGAWLSNNKDKVVFMPSNLNDKIKYSKNLYSK